MHSSFDLNDILGIWKYTFASQRTAAAQTAAPV